MPKILGLILISSSICLFSCKKKKNSASTTTATCSGTISYNTTIKPLMDQNCNTSGCHNSSNAGGYNFTSYASVSSNATLILKSIRHESGVQAMPQGASKLSSTSADNVDCWIQQGKANN